MQNIIHPNVWFILCVKVHAWLSFQATVVITEGSHLLRKYSLVITSPGPSAIIIVDSLNHLYIKIKCFRLKPSQVYSNVIFVLFCKKSCNVTLKKKFKSDLGRVHMHNLIKLTRWAFNENGKNMFIIYILLIKRSFKNEVPGTLSRNSWGFI